MVNCVTAVLHHWPWYTKDGGGVLKINNFSWIDDERIIEKKNPIQPHIKAWLNYCVLIDRFTQSRWQTNSNYFFNDECMSASMRVKVWIKSNHFVSFTRTETTIIYFRVVGVLFLVKGLIYKIEVFLCSWCSFKCTSLCTSRFTEISQ